MIICGTCKFFKRYEPDVPIFGKPKPSENGRCYRYPPVPVGAGSMSAQGVHGFAKSCRPQVHEEAFCGEWVKLDAAGAP